MNARLFAAILLIGVFTVIGSAQSTATRPRVAPTPTPPVLGNDTYRPAEEDGPPTLRKGNQTPPSSSSASPTPTPAGDDGDVIKVETNLVTMPVSVLDRDGRFVSGLQKPDFKIFENGVEQKVEYFQSVEQPFSVIILLDVSPSTAFQIGEIQNAAITFIEQLRPADRVMVMSFDENVHVLSPFTNNRIQLRNAISQAQFGDGTSLYEAVDQAITQELSQVRGRKAVVLFTDGVDTTSKRATYQSTVDETEELDALFYTIRYDTSHDRYAGNTGSQSGGGGGTVTNILGAILTGGGSYGGGGGRHGRGGGWGGGGGSQAYETGHQYLLDLAEKSGGREFEATSMTNVDAAFSGIAEELRRQYSVGYYPDTVGKLGERRQVKIRVMRPDVVVRAKTSYVIGQTNRTIAGK